jgi:hypothetical protein
MKTYRIKELFVLTGISIYLLIGINNPAISQVKAWEGTITIPIYGWEDDVNPKFWAMEAGAKGSTTVRASIIYPYTMQDHLSRKLENVTYKALFRNCPVPGSFILCVWELTIMGSDFSIGLLIRERIFPGQKTMKMLLQFSQSMLPSTSLGHTMSTLTEV